ncbi:MAG: preprotein translocase subunit SecE [Kiritimatiellae bacterium]|nr:preprotein translocase subunit SecE [Kiritimatiellia bacterium]
MEKIRALIGRSRGFLADVHAELRKCSWPSRTELFESTVVVIVSVVLLAAFVAVSDGLVVLVLQAILPR